MIKEIRFKNYKAFKDEQTLEIRPITLLVGKNSSGKTSLCNLIHMLSDALTPIEDESLAIRKNIDAFVRGGGALFTKDDYTSLQITAVNDNDESFTINYVHAGGKSYVSELKYGTILGEIFHQSYDDELRATIHNSLRGALMQLGANLHNFAYSANHILPVRHGGINFLMGTPQAIHEVRGFGEMAYAMLANSYSQETSLYPNVKKWFHDNLEGQDIIVKPIPNAGDNYYLFLVTKREIPIEEVGQGVQQVLPVIVETYNENASDVTIIEQPALHLHPAAHAAVIRRIAESAKSLNRHYVIESHSENILLELRRMVSDPDVDLSSEDVIVYYVDIIDGVSCLKPIHISQCGELSFWPTGVFSEGFDILSQIMQNKS